MLRLTARVLWDRTHTPASRSGHELRTCGSHHFVAKTFRCQHQVPKTRKRPRFCRFWQLSQAEGVLESKRVCRQSHRVSSAACTLASLRFGYDKYACTQESLWMGGGVGCLLWERTEREAKLESWQFHMRSLYSVVTVLSSATSHLEQAAISGAYSTYISPTNGIFCNTAVQSHRHLHKRLNVGKHALLADQLKSLT